LKEVEKKEEQHVTVDFTGVREISPLFATEICEEERIPNPIVAPV